MSRRHSEQLRRGRQQARRQYLRENCPDVDASSEQARAWIIFGGDLMTRLLQKPGEMTRRQQRIAARDSLRAAVRQHIKSKEKRAAGFREVAREATQLMRRLTKRRPMRKGVM